MAQQLVYAQEISDDARQEETEKWEKEVNKEFVEMLQNIDVTVREMLEDMFEIVRKHEKTNKNIKKDLEVSLQALQTHYADTEAHTKYRDIAAYNRKVEEITDNKKSLFLLERHRYFKRHRIRMEQFKILLEQFEGYLNQPRLVHNARQKVLDLREIQKFKNRQALAQITQWDLTYDDEFFEQSQVVDSILVSDDAYKNTMRNFIK